MIVAAVTSVATGSSPNTRRPTGFETPSIGPFPSIPTIPSTIA